MYAFLGMGASRMYAVKVIGWWRDADVWIFTMNLLGITCTSIYVGLGSGTVWILWKFGNLLESLVKDFIVFISSFAYIACQ